MRIERKSEVILYLYMVPVTNQYKCIVFIF